MNLEEMTFEELMILDAKVNKELTKRKMEKSLLMV
jgi:hypothetical protein